MPEPLGYLLTWTCYGTWLHGDERGSVDWDHNQFNTPNLSPDPIRFTLSARRMTKPAVVLSEAARRSVANTLLAHCLLRGWTLHAATARTNHIHAVLSCPIHPRDAMNQFKAWSTRRLREAKLFASDAQIWTEGGSHRWLWNQPSLQSAIRYVAEFQGDDGPPGSIVSTSG